MKTISYARDVKPAVAEDGVPWCSDDACVHFDGKRCKVMGRRPTDVCVPAVQQMAEYIDDSMTGAGE